MPEAAETTGKKTLVQKLADIMAEVGRIPKNGRNDFHKYDYVTEADLVEAVRTKLAERHVFVFTSIEDSRREGSVTEVYTLHTFVDGETGETFSVKGYGQGEDKADKGGYKAQTGAMKYFLMKNFLVATGDDPEQHDGKQAKEPARSSGQQTSPPKQPTAAQRTTNKPAAKAPLTVTEAMERMNAQKDKAKFQGAYDAAFKQPWSEQNAQALGECYVAGVCRFSGWIANGSKTQLHENGRHVADIVRDERGKLTIKRV